MRHFWRGIGWVFLIAIVVGCSHSQPQLAYKLETPAPKTTQPTTPLRPTLAPTSSPLVLPTPTPTNIVTKLLTTSAERYCRPADEARWCFTPLAVHIADYVFQQPNDPSKKALLERIITLVHANNKEVGSPAAAARWVFADWVTTLAQTLPHTLDPHRSRITLKNFTFVPTNLDNDDVQDYIVTGSVSSDTSGYDQLGWLRWMNNQWRITYTRLIGKYNSQIHAADVNGDGQQDLVILSVTCGSACTQSLSITTWRDDQWQHLDQALDQGNMWQIDPIQQKLQFTRADPVSVRYEFNGESLAPSQLLTPTGNFATTTGIQMDYAHALLQLGRYKQAIDALEIAAAQSNGEAPFGYKSTIRDARPLAWFRIGMINIIQNDPAAAHTAWQTLLDTYPRAAVSQTVQQLNLTNFDGSITMLCQALDSIKPMPTRFDEQDFYGNRFPYNGYDWLSVCNPTLLVPLQPWQRTTPLTDQMQMFGVPWQELSNSYDLNRDGSVDVIGSVDWLGMHTFWAMLSAGDTYQPLNGMQPWGLDTPLARVVYTDYDLTAHREPRILDLDSNGQPEILTKIGSTQSMFAAWTGTRFELNTVDFQDYNYPIQPFTPAITLERQPDGTQLLVATQPITDASIPPPQRYSYTLKNNRLVRVEPLAYQSQDVFLSLNDVLTSLYETKDPTMALSQLDAYSRIQPLSATDHEYLVLRALALDYLGRTSEAQALLNQVATSSQDTGWRLLARERGK